MGDLLRALTRKRQPEPPVEMLDGEALRSRIGEPLRRKSADPAQTPYVRADGRQEDRERRWRKVAGLTR